MITQKVLHYTIETDQQMIGGRDGFTVQVYNSKATKHPLIYNYFFRSIESRQEWIDNFSTNVLNWNKRKEERKAQRKAMTNHAEIGDILINSWGYEQTNTDYYQVVRKTEKGVYLREISCRLEGEEGLSSMAGYTYPIPDSFKDKPEIFAVCKSEGRQYSVNVGKYNFQSASLTDPKEKHYCSWYA